MNPYRRERPPVHGPARLATAVVTLLGVATLSGCFPATDRMPGPEESDVATSGALDDAYVGYYDDLLPAVDLVDPASMWGSFGAEGETAPASWIDASQPPGDLTVVLECAGADSVALRVGSRDAPPDRTTTPLLEVDCPSTVTTQVTTTTEGFAFEVDSGGSVGAFRILVGSAR